MKSRFPTMVVIVACFLGALTTDLDAGKKKKKKNQAKEDPYAEYVWPPPPDKPRIKLVDVIGGRADVEGVSKLKKALVGMSSTSKFDNLNKPYDVGIDSRGRLLVTDIVNGGLIRFDREEGRMDVLGSRGRITIKKPAGLGIGPDDRVYVADLKHPGVLAIAEDGSFERLYGASGELQRPADAAVSPDGTALYVADSAAHRIIVFDLDSGDELFGFGGRGIGDGQFNYPSSLTFGPEGNLFVVDQQNARVQMFTADGDFLDRFGERGSSFGQFVRPKGIAVDERGFIYVADFTHNNIQLFDFDFSLLTFIGSGGTVPGTFMGASGVAARGGEFAVVDQFGRRVQLFRLLDTLSGE